MPQVDVPNQFGDPTLSADEAAAACGPAAAVAFARANGRNPTLREALDLAKQVGWTAAGGMNGVQNQKRLLDRMGIPSELDTNASPDAIRRRVQAGQDVTVSTPVHYYVVDAVDERGRVHVGQSGLARRGGAEWMTLEDIASRDGGINGALYQTVADTGSPQTGAGVDTSGDRPPSEFESTPSRAPSAAVLPGQSVYARVVAAKGDPISIRPAPGQETVETEQPETNFLGEPTGKTTRVKGPNPNPVYRYTFADGTYVDAQSTDTGSGQDISIRGGTALASTAKPPAGQQPTTVSTSANEPYIVTRMPDGSLKKEPNPNYVAPTATTRPTTVSTSANEPYIVTRQPDGSLTREPNPNYVPPKASAGHQTHAVGGRLYTTDENGNVVNTVDLRSPEDKAKEQLALAQGQQSLTKGEIDIQAARQKLLPAAQQVMQGLSDTITYLQGMYERGQIELPQMNAYVQMAKDAADASLRGTTPAEEAAAKQAQKNSEKTLGLNILNQRLVSGAGLANTLMSAATGPHVMLRPGQQSLGVDPLEGLKALVDQLGGGQGVSDYGKSLLLGAQGAPPAGPQPAGL